MKVIVVGAGPAGMIAAGVAAKNGHQVTLLERNEKLGKKLYITGKGRCNLTNTDNNEAFLNNVVTNPKFLISSLTNFSTQNTFDFFEGLGLKLKVERGGRVFPDSDKASDVTKTLEDFMHRYGVKIKLNSFVNGLTVNDNQITSVTTSENYYPCDVCILATGGLSYSSTGSDGNMFKHVHTLGHKITALKPSLVGIDTIENYGLQGLTLKNVNASLYINNKLIKSEFGEMLFTHTGLSGPIILSLSSYAAKYNLQNAFISIDLKPALTFDELDLRIQRDFKEFSNKQFKNSLDNLLPQNLIPVIIKECQIDEAIKVNQITATQRLKLVTCLKNFKLNILHIRSIEEAIVTSGGVDVKQVNPKTMQSKLVSNLYFAGEMLDIDGLTGGYNIQIALSTGVQAGNGTKGE